MQDCPRPTEQGLWLSHLNQNLAELSEFRSTGTKSLRRLWNVLVEDPWIDELLVLIGDETDLNNMEVRVRPRDDA